MLRGPPQKTAPLTLDEILAMDVPNFREDFNRVRTTLNSLITNPAFKNTSIENQVVPAAQGLQTWLGLFECSMRDNRLPGATKARVCFAERGMFYLLVLLNSLENQSILLRNEPNQTPALKAELRSMRDTLVGYVVPILGTRKNGGLSLMRNWLATLVDVVPLEMRSPHTPLTPANLKIIDGFIMPNE